MRFFLKLAYNGSNYHGWQRQPNAISIQEKIESALSKIFGRELTIVGAGRTDSGVHAREMYAHFDTEQDIQNVKRVLQSLNMMCGKDIAIYDIIPVIPEAHARFDAISRTYKYYINLKRNPFEYLFSHFINTKLNLEKMNEAASVLLKTNDFTSFAKLHSDNKTNICHITEAHWDFSLSESNLIFTISADRFLRNMVRAIVGTLLSVGTGKTDLNGFMDIIHANDRCKAGTSAPANGLFLEKIIYPEEIFI